MKTPPSVRATCGALLLLAVLFVVPDEVQGRNVTTTSGFNSFRLPNSTVPTHYTLRLDTDIHKGNFEYSGRSLIRIKVVEATDQIVLHSVRSVITCLELRKTDHNSIPITGFASDEEKEFLIINVGQVLQPHSGIYTLEIKFNNSIDRNDLAGFYRSSYRTENGTIRTPRMQTYLVAWLVSDFVSVEVVLPQPKLTIATWAEPSLAHLLSYSVNVSTRFIRVMEEYFGKRFSLPKIDNVVIPRFGIASHAMENWGLVTYQQAFITYDPLQDGFSSQFPVTRTIAHEYIHQFFGNLLAPKWWSYLWLNEGFACFYQYYVGSISHPEVIQRELFVTKVMQKAFDVDSYAKVSMTHYVESRPNISQLFSSVMYEKAASVLRMMNYALGERTFQKGVHYYLQKNDVQGRGILTSRAFDSFRLPNNTVPTHYTLHLDTDVDRGIFDYTGKVQIRINVVEATDQIVLHSLRNVITNLQLRNSAQLAVPVKGHEFDEEKEFLVINLGTVLQPNSGSYTLDIDFTNSIDRNDQSGFYRSSYTDEQGVTRYHGLTQFESVDARTSFPCYDEPGIKTTYDISITCGTAYHARSNAPLLGIKLLPGGKKITTFATTPRMQTYLVAWLVSDFVYEREVLKQPQLAVSTWSKPSSANLLSYSVDASVRFIRAMEEYFGELYTMSKIDNVAIKDGDYAAGAMENWGLVTYRESAIFFNPETQTQSQQIGVVTIVGHEFTHQFFGNLLAPKWWSYLWLSEGFARLYQYYVGSISHPEHGLRERFVTGPMQNAFSSDGSPTIRPMTYYTDTRAGISRLFDRIAYDKSGSVLRMMSYALGERTFQKGLRYYVQQNKANGVVEESNLFASLEQAAKEDAVLPLTFSMHDIFGSWSNQAGVPIVSVRREGDEFYFTQTRFFAEPQEDPLDSSWWIPISFSTPSNTAYEKLPAFWMPPHVSEVSYTIPLAEGETLMFNPYATGDYNAALGLMSYLREETDYVPWVVAHENLRYLKTMLRGDEKASELLQTFTEQLATPLLEKYSFAKRSGESANDEELRSIAIEFACSASESCKSAALASVTVKSRSVRNVYGATDRALLCSGLQQAEVEERQGFVSQVSRMLESQPDDPFARKYIQEVVACTGEELKGVRYLLELDESERSNALYRLIVGSNVTPGDLLQSLHSELSRRQSISINPATIPKVLLELSHYVTEPSEISLLTSVVSQFAPSVASEVSYQLMANRKWIERNVGPLTAALSLIVSV
uniref:Aminopeptidase n=1 Tax=Anopheles atroparvus TaxID=41427 RepID=A0A182IYB0_ANOAO